MTDTIMIDHILVRRFVRCYSWWFDTSLYSTLKPKDLAKYRSVPHFTHELKRRDDLAWHLGRVRFFYDILKNGKDLDPVSIDNKCYYGYISNEPVLVDGHHRLAAHWLAKRKTIPSYYSGRVDVLEYLTGKRRSMPRD